MKTSDTMHTPTVLMILDGFGLAKTHVGNAITPDTAPHIFSYMQDYPSSQLNTSGKHVGLFPKQQGNSEAGHMNIGAGRIVKQDLVMISDAIKDGTFFKNDAFKQAIQYIKKHKSAAHVMGLLTDGNSAHAHPSHLYAMIDLLAREGIQHIYIHLITDGRDSSPHAALQFLALLRKKMNGHGEIATVMGRYYGMDRNKVWERTEAAYNAMVRGKGQHAKSAEEAIAQAYNRGETDEYISPTIIADTMRVADHNALFFINARSDRARQLTKAFVQPDFAKKNKGVFRRYSLPQGLNFVAMTDFGPDLPGIHTAFPSPDISNCLPLAIGEERKQLYISETEKYAHVTYFINGGYPAPLNGEDRVFIPSPNVQSYAKKPGMNTTELTATILTYLKQKKYDFMCVNFPNADMLGHTGNISAAKRGIRIMDRHIHRIVKDVLKRDGQVLIIADHGNAEQMIHTDTEEMMTEHTTNPVPCILIRPDTKGIKLKKGILADVAPTVLKMLDIKKPREMTGKALF